MSVRFHLASISFYGSILLSIRLPTIRCTYLYGRVQLNLTWLSLLVIGQQNDWKLYLSVWLGLSYLIYILWLCMRCLSHFPGKEQNNSFRKIVINLHVSMLHCVRQFSVSFLSTSVFWITEYMLTHDGHWCNFCFTFLRTYKYERHK